MHSFARMVQDVVDKQAGSRVSAKYAPSSFGGQTAGGH